MARAVHLLLIATFCCALQFTAATDQSLECYTCIGYDPNQDEDQMNNNKACAEGSFSASSVLTVNNTAPQGITQLQCLVVTITNGYENGGRKVTFRSPHNATNIEPFSMRYAPTEEGEVDISWCNTALCNGNEAAGSSPIVVATLLAALALYGLAA